MNTYYIRVLIDPTGALRGINAIKGALRGMEGHASRLGSMFKTLFAVTVATRVVGGVIKLGDAYSDLENKVRQASGKHDLLATSMDKVFKAANRARTDVSAFGKTVLAVSGATANMNLGFDASVRMTETLSKMMKLGGASTEEAKSATIQLGQALRKGKLNGDEMRSVMENSIELQKALAKSLGVSTDELLTQSKAGNITRKVMVDALIKGAADVDKRFAEMTLKVSDAWTVLHNKAVEFAGTLDIAGVLGPALMFVADHFEVLAKLALAAGQVIGVYFVRQGVMMAVRGLALLGAAALANPFTALMYAVTITIALLRQFASDIKVSADSIATIGDVFSVVVDDIVAAAKETFRVIGAVAEEAASLLGEMVDLSDVSFKDIVMFFARFADLILNIANFLKETVSEGFKEMGLAIVENLIDVYIKARKWMNTQWYGDEGAAGRDTTVGWKDGASYLYNAGGDIGDAKAAYQKDLAQRDAVRSAYLLMNNIGQTAAGMNDTQWQQEQLRYLGELDKILKNLGPTSFEVIQQVNAMRSAVTGSRQEVVNRGVIAQSMLPDPGMTVEETKANRALADNPFRGSTDEWRAGAKGRWEKMESIPITAASDWLKSVFDRAEAAAGRPKKKKWGMGEFGGKSVEPPDAAAERQAKQMQNKLDALLSKTFPVQKAQIELRKDQEVVDWGVKNNKITAHEGLKVMQQRREELKDMLDPYAAIVRKAEEEILATNNLNGAYATQYKVKEQLNKLNMMGVDVTNKQVFALQRLADLEVGLSDDQKLKQGMLGGANIISGDQQRIQALAQAKLQSSSPADFERKASVIDDTQFFARHVTVQEEYANGLRAIVQLGIKWADEGMAQNDVLTNQAVLLEKLNEQFGVLTERQQSVTEGLRDGWNQTFMEFGKTAEQVANYVQQLFTMLTDVIVKLVTRQKISWEDMFNSVLEGLAQIATQRLIWGIMNLITPGGAASSTVVGATSTPHLAEGGTFKINGPSGRDAVFTPLMLTNGEHVTVTPRGEPPPGHGGGGGALVVVVRNEREASLIAMQSPAGRRIQVRNVAYDEAYLRAIQTRG